MFSLSPEINCFFGNWQQSNARAGQKKKMFFFGNALPKSKKQHSQVPYFALTWTWSI